MSRQSYISQHSPTYLNTVLHIALYIACCYMDEKLPIRHKTLSNKSINPTYRTTQKLELCTASCDAWFCSGQNKAHVIWLVERYWCLAYSQWLLLWKCQLLKRTMCRRLTYQKSLIGEDVGKVSQCGRRAAKRKPDMLQSDISFVMIYAKLLLVIMIHNELCQLDWLIEWIVFYAVSVIVQPYIDRVQIYLLSLYTLNYDYPDTWWTVEWNISYL